MSLLSCVPMTSGELAALLTSRRAKVQTQVLAIIKDKSENSRNEKLATENVSEVLTPRHPRLGLGADPSRINKRSAGTAELREKILGKRKREAEQRGKMQEEEEGRGRAFR